MKIAVIGCGNIANNAHIPAYMKNPEAEIVYFCDILPERAEAAVEKYGCGKAVVDYKEVLADPQVEAVSVCTPNNVHAQIAIDALRAGKNVLCEKPAARTYEEALEMQKVQHETGKVLNIGVVNRFNDSVNRIRDYINEGKLGKDMENYVYTDMWAGPPKYDGVYDVDDSVAGLVRTTGPVLTINGAWAQNIGESEMFIDFIGTKAGIRLQYGKEFTVYTTENNALVSYTPEFTMRNHFENEINAFVDCIKTGKKLPSHIDTAIITAQMMQALYDSAEQHREIVL